MNPQTNVACRVTRVSQLIEVNEQYLELMQLNSFLCDAVAALHENQSQLNEHSVNGLRLQTLWLKGQFEQHHRLLNEVCLNLLE